MSKFVQKYLDIVKRRNPGEAEFHQCVEEILSSLEPVVEQNPQFVEAGIIERLIEPEREISFKVAWIDDAGKVQVNRGFRVQFNSALGPYKGGLRFAPSVYAGITNFLGFEQIFKNALTGLPIGGGKGGSDFDPNGKSDNEVMRFCQSFMTELYRHIGPDTDSPAGDLGVGAREIGYLFGQYKRITSDFNGTMTGKSLTWGGLNGRTEATGYGIVYFARAMMEANGNEIKGKTVAVSGFGNVSWGTVQKCNMLGAKVITISGPDGYILDEDGVTAGEKEDFMLELRASGKNIVAPYAEKFPSAKFFPGEKPWGVKVDVVIPCATQNEIHMEDAKKIVANGTKYVCEGANMPTTNEALNYLQEHCIVGPSKAANAGGVACSAIEMSQNASKTIYTAEQVHVQLRNIMQNIHDHCAEASKKYGFGYNLVAGANIAGFERVAKAMMEQGVY